MTDAKASIPLKHMILKGHSPPPLGKLPRKGFYKGGVGVEITPPQSPPVAEAAAALPPPPSGLQPNLAERLQQAQSFLPQAGPPNQTKVKCVLVGDGAIGKTSLVVSYTTNGYPTEYEPTAFDNYVVVVTVDSQPITLQLCDTAGQDDFDSLRPLCYPNTDIFLLCFSVVLPSSFHNLADKWLAEIRRHCPASPLILVGTQCDLRNDVKELIELARYGERPVTEAEARQRAAEVGALDYIECSALTQKNLKEVFDSVILAALHHNGLLGAITTRPCGGKKARKGKGREEPAPAVQVTVELEGESKNKSWRRFCCLSS